MERGNEQQRPNVDDSAINALREAFAPISERLTPEIEPAPVYSPRPLDRATDAG